MIIYKLVTNNKKKELYKISIDNKCTIKVNI